MHAIFFGLFIDKGIKKHSFNSRTEFIREAVRDKLQNLTKDEQIAEFLKLRGKYKHYKTTDEDIRRIKEESGKKLFAELEKRFK